jgi:hypothetical protein
MSVVLTRIENALAAAGIDPDPDIVHPAIDWVVRLMDEESVSFDNAVALLADLARRGDWPGDDDEAATPTD